MGGKEGTPGSMCVCRWGEGGDRRGEREREREREREVHVRISDRFTCHTAPEKAFELHAVGFRDCFFACH